MKVLQINTFGNKSTGGIAVSIFHALRDRGHEGMIAFARNSIAMDVPYFKIGNKWSVYTDAIMARLFDKEGFYSKCSTKKLIAKIYSYRPDIIHLHNLHGYYINIKLLFDFLRTYNRPVIWTLHDCWAFTGHCGYYSMVSCEKWKTGCNCCPQKRSYPKSIIVDNSRQNYREKKKVFTSLPNLHLVCVSKWLENEVKQSFLKNIPSRVIYNGIDLEVFKPTDSDFRIKYNLQDKRIILGVASTWEIRKGLDDFIRLSTLLDDRYKIVLVGVDERVRRKIPDSILCLPKIKSAQELAKIYSAADVFFNASIGETFGLTTVEAMSCGTPAVVYDTTALSEIVSYNSGVAVKKNDILSVVNAMESIDCSNKFEIRRQMQMFSEKEMVKNYLKLYEEVLTQNIWQRDESPCHMK